MPRQHENDPAMNDSVHQMSLLVGELKGELRAVKDVVENLNRTWGERERIAVDGRRAVHEKVDAMSKDLNRFGADMENLSREVITVIKPAVETMKTEREQREGASKLGKGMWIGLSGIFGGGIAEVLHHFFDR